MPRKSLWVRLQLQLADTSVPADPSSRREKRTFIADTQVCISTSTRTASHHRSTGSTSRLDFCPWMSLLSSTGSDESDAANAASGPRSPRPCAGLYRCARACSGLHAASVPLICCGCGAWVQVLEELGTDLNLRAASGSTALHAAAAQGHTSTIQARPCTCSRRRHGNVNMRRL